MMFKLYDLVYFNCIVDVLLFLFGMFDFECYLEKFVFGWFELFVRDYFVVKDYLWEVEFLSILRWKFIDVEFKELDIVVNFEGEELGIVCKKIYFEKNVEKVFLKGVL